MADLSGNILPLNEDGDESSLADFLSQLKEKRGDSKTWLRKSHAVMRFMAALGDEERVFCTGDLFLTDHHYPAVLTYNPSLAKTRAWAPVGDDDVMTPFDEHHFFSGVPHVGIAQEVFNKSASTDIVI